LKPSPFVFFEKYLNDNHDFRFPLNQPSVGATASEFDDLKKLEKPDRDILSV